MKPSKYDKLNYFSYNISLHVRKHGLVIFLLMGQDSLLGRPLAH